MSMVVEEYGMFMVSFMAFAGLCVMIHLFQTRFREASRTFIMSITGVSESESHYNQAIPN